MFDENKTDPVVECWSQQWTQFDKRLVGFIVVFFSSGSWKTGAAVVLGGQVHIFYWIYNCKINKDLLDALKITILTLVLLAM